MNNLKIRLFALMAFFAISIGLYAQSEVRGKLVDANSGEGLIGAAVYLEGNTGVGTVTELDGSFLLKLKKDGKYTMSFSYIGYEKQTQEVTVSGSVNIGTVELENSAVGIGEVAVVASFATDRKTPVALSSIPAEIIAEKLGNQEFPEILKSTPSVYATKDGGGFGDSRINIRGFNTSNIGVLINGVPVNDMENGRVYFSNWAGLTDVTSLMQVQRGLGASKLAISSVGGTINILTKSADAKQGGTVYAGMGNDGYQKLNFSVSTGLMENGWAVTLMGGRVEGDGYIDGTNFQGYNYFANITKVINPQHRLSFQIFGAPQWHNQRGNRHYISTYQDLNPDLPFSNTAGTKLNSEWGIRDGEVYGGGYGYNFYHKPQISLSHYWDINDDTRLSTSVYASIASGGGRRLRGAEAGNVNFSNSSVVYPSMEWRTGTGLIDWDKMIAHNQQLNGEADFFITNSMNKHQWYGLLSTMNTKAGLFDLTFGLDLRYYDGKHFEKIDDLLGGRFVIDDSNVNRPANELLSVGDKYSYYNDMQVFRNGLFAQAEVDLDKLTAFLSAATSLQNVQRIDHFLYEVGNQKSGWSTFMDWSVKAGANYNLNENHNVYVNAGYFTRSPFVRFVFDGNTNDKVDNPEYEKVLTFEAGYGYHSRTVDVKFGAYRTEWRDQGLSRSIGDQVFSLLGLNSLHQGLELEATYKPVANLTIRGMASYGDWSYMDDVNFQQFDDQNNLIGSFNAFIEDVSVGNSAQTTAALGVNYKFFNHLNLGVDATYFGRNYADFDPTTRTGSNSAGINSWKMPDVTIIDCNFGYNFKISDVRARLTGNVNNLLDTEYVTDATDGTNHDWKTSPVYYGFGRTYSLGLKLNF